MSTPEEYEAMISRLLEIREEHDNGVRAAAEPGGGARLCLSDLGRQVADRVTSHMENLYGPEADQDGSDGNWDRDGGDWDWEAGQ